MNKILKKLIAFSMLTTTGMYLCNRFIESNTISVSSSKNNKLYKWKDMNIVYSVKGESNATPLLLIHNLFPASSKEEWTKVDQSLAKKYKIYEIDLPGCGKSDKPNETYINYMYVQLIQDFIKNIIKEKTSICATAYSSSFTLMTARIAPELIDKIIIINPTSIEDLVAPVSKKTELFKNLYSMPIIGTFIYNIKMSKASIMDDFKYVYYYHHRNVSQKEIDLAYFNAHYKNSSGRYLLGSIVGNYTNINIIHALPLIQNEIYLIGNGLYKKVMSEYKKYNENIKTSYISNCRLLPQLEIPETIIARLLSIME